MCRTGGRRCGVDHEQREEHNRRRRENRAARRQVVEWAVEQQMGTEVVDQVKAMPPAAARKWGEEQGALEAPAPAPPPASPTTPGGQGAARLRNRWRVTKASTGHTSLDEATVAALADQGHRRGEAALLDGPIVSSEDLDEDGVNDTRLVATDQGNQGFHKGFGRLHERMARKFGHDEPLQPLHEVGAWRLADAMGERYRNLVPPCVVAVDNENEWGSLSQRVPGRPPSLSNGFMVAMGMAEPEPAMRDALRDSGVSRQQLDDAAFFDAVIGQTDRHIGNVLVGPGNRLHLIDHGFAFSRDGDPCNWSALVDLRCTDGRTALTAEERQLCGRIAADRDLLGMAPSLTPERAAAVRSRAERMHQSGEILPTTTWAPHRPDFSTTAEES